MPMPRWDLTCLPYPARVVIFPADFLFKSTIPPEKNKVQMLRLATLDFLLQQHIIHLILLVIIFLTKKRCVIETPAQPTENTLTL
ncbi:MAG: hypothetical protein ACYC2W_00980 [Desulfurivibrionaceae bacterium]